MEMITTLADLVTALDGGHSVDLRKQDRTIVVEVYKSRVGISVLQDYARFAKVSHPTP
jgi:tRNA(Ser,Leu) C12 N-acetylase TAN1